AEDGIRDFHVTGSDVCSSDLLSPLYVSLNFTSANFVSPEAFRTLAFIFTRFPSIVPFCSLISPQSFQFGNFISSNATSVSRSGRSEERRVGKESGASRSRETG